MTANILYFSQKADREPETGGGTQQKHLDNARNTVGNLNMAFYEQRLRHNNPRMLQLIADFRKCLAWLDELIGIENAIIAETPYEWNPLAEVKETLEALLDWYFEYKPYLTQNRPWAKKLRLRLEPYVTLLADEQESKDTRAALRLVDGEERGDKTPEA